MNAAPPPGPTAKGPAQGERKIVTVLFADVVGSTALAESLDPEDWAEILSGMHAHISESVTRYDGLIAQLLGDGALAFFGAPVAHEDDPERAVLASLDLLASVDGFAAELRAGGFVPQFGMRVGLNTGLVVVGSVGAGTHVEYLAVGDTVNLAARLQGAAAPGSIALSANTAHAVQHAFDLISLGELTIKGKADTVPAYRLVGPKAHPESKRGIVGLDSPVIGRDSEIAKLRQRLNALAGGEGQVISLIGEAGLGKSRLVAEVVVRSPEPFERAEGRCLSFTSSAPYAPVAAMLSQLMAMDTAGSDAEKMANVRAAVPAAAAPFIATLLGLPLEGEELNAARFLRANEPGRLRERMIAAICGEFERLAGIKPVALIVEDLHWADPSTLDVLERLLPVTERVPLAIVAAFRPGAHEPSWRFHEAASRAARYMPLFLEPLSEPEAQALVAHLLHVEGLPEPVRAMILAKAEGNPFYLEELIRSLLDAGLVVRQDGRWVAAGEIAQVALPDSLAGVITARLDRLDRASKLVAQTAAVLGRDFSVDLLSRVVDIPDALPASLALLAERELIKAKAPGFYHFKHVLSQEAAYNSLLLRERRSLHHRAAEALAAAPGSDSARAGTIASHFLSAQEPVRALPYLIAAGESALAAYSTAEALTLFRQATEIPAIGDDATLVRRAYEGLGGSLALSADPNGALAAYGDLELYAAAHSDGPAAVSALNKAARIQSMWLGQFETARVQLDRAQVLAEACNDRSGLAEGLVMRCSIATARADFDDAVQHLDQLVSIGQELRGDYETAFGLVHRANSWTYLARFDLAWPAAQAACDFTQSCGDLLHYSQALALPVAWCHISFGDLDAAHAAGLRAVEISGRLSENFGLVQAAHAVASIARWRGDYDRSLEHWGIGLAAAQQSGLPFIIAWMLGGICGTTHESDPAKLGDTSDLQQQALELLAHPLGGIGGGTVWADLGECELAAGRLSSARQMLENGLTERTPFMYLNRPRFLAGMARVELAGGNTSSASQHIASARAFVEEHNMRWCRPLVAMVEAEVAGALEQPALALDCYRKAQAEAHALGMRPLAASSQAAIARLRAAQ